MERLAAAARAISVATAATLPPPPCLHAGLRHENDFVGVQANKDDTVDFIKGSKKNVSKPAKAATHYKWKQNARRSLVSVGKQVSSMRPDLKVGMPEPGYSALWDS